MCAMQAETGHRKVALTDLAEKNRKLMKIKDRLEHNLSELGACSTTAGSDSRTKAPYERCSSSFYTLTTRTRTSA
jgi:hypothetical protein